MVVIPRALTFLSLAFVLVSCGPPEPLEPARYSGSDALAQTIVKNIASSPNLELVMEIDHSRLGYEVESALPPTRVIMFSDPQLETALVSVNPLIGIDLPMRVLAYDTEQGHDSRVVANTFEYLESRYQLEAESVRSQKQLYQQNLEMAVSGLADSAITSFADNDM